MSLMASHITSLTIVYSTVYSGADQRKLQSSVSLAFVWGIHRGPVNSPHKRPITRKLFPFDDVIMYKWLYCCGIHISVSMHFSKIARLWILPCSGECCCGTKFWDPSLVKRWEYHHISRVYTSRQDLNKRDFPDYRSKVKVRESPGDLIVSLSLTLSPSKNKIVTEGPSRLIII